MIAKAKQRDKKHTFLEEKVKSFPRSWFLWTGLPKAELSKTNVTKKWYAILSRTLEKLLLKQTGNWKYIYIKVGS